MPAFSLLCSLLLISLAQQPDEWATGQAFERAVRGSTVSVFWEQAPLKSQLQLLARNQQVAVLLDRRIDPGRKIDWRGRELNFEQFLWQVGEEQQLGVTQVGDMLYLGPRETALVLARQNQQWAARLEEPGFPPALRRQLTEAVRWKFSSAAEPSVWLSQDVRRAGLAVVNPEKLPFDFWEPIDWPALPRYQAWLLLLAGFELGIELEEGDLRLVDLRLPEQMSCDYSIEGLERTAVEKMFEDLPGLKWKSSGKTLTADGPPLDQSQLSKRIAFLRRVSSAPEGTRVFTLKTNAPRGSILATIAQQLGVKLEFPEEVRPLLDERIELDVHQISLEQLLDKTLRGTGLKHRLEKDRLHLVPN